MELRAIQKRNREDTVRARENGEPKQKPSYGYKYVRLTATGKVDHVEIDEVAAEIIRNVAERILADEEGEVTHYTEASRLNRECIPSPADHRAAMYGRPTKGTKWSPRGLKVILTSEAALGYLMHDGKPVTGQDGKSVRLADPLWDTTTRDALIEATKPKREDPRKGKRAPKGIRLLAGRAFCGNCGTRLSCSSVKHGRVYRCEVKQHGTPEMIEACETSPNIFMSILDEAAEKWFLDTYGSRKLFHKVYDPGTGHQSRIAEIESSRKRLRDDRAAGLYDAPDDAEWFRTRYSALGGELTQLKALPDSPARMRWAFTGKTPSDHWREARDMVARRELLASYQVRVTVFPENSRHERIWFSGLDPEEASSAREAEAVVYQAELEMRAEAKAKAAADQTWETEEAVAEQEQEHQAATTLVRTLPVTAKEVLQLAV